MMFNYKTVSIDFDLNCQLSLPRNLQDHDLVEKKPDFHETLGKNSRLGQQGFHKNRKTENVALVFVA